MAYTRLYWIPHGFGLHEGTYVSYPAEELFAILTLESHRNRCEVVGENLGTVPPEIDEALPRHRIWGTFLAQFEAAGSSEIAPPAEDEMAQVGTHDTPTFGGWLAGADIDDRVRHGLLPAKKAPRERRARSQAVRRLAKALEGSVEAPREFLAKVLEWLGASDSPLVVPWLEDLWLEGTAVNLPGTRSSERPNWQRPMGRLLDEVFSDSDIDELLRRLHQARSLPGDGTGE
jgi:4-alpha-glucanotransferase